MAENVHTPVPAPAAGAETSRERILAVAARLFAERGFAATSVDAVCRESGFSKPTIYWHFGSKQGLLVAVLERNAARSIERIRSDALSAETGMARIDAVIHRWRDIVANDSAELRLPVMAALEMGGRSDEVRESVVRIWRASERAMVEGIEGAIGRRLDDLDLVGHVAVTLLQGAAMRFSVDGDEERLERNLQELKRVLVLTIVDKIRRADGGAAGSG